MTEERIEIEVLFPITLHLAVTSPDIVLLLRSDAVFVRGFDGDRCVSVGPEYTGLVRLVACIGVHLKEIPAGERFAAVVARCHFLDVNAVLAYLDLVA